MQALDLRFGKAVYVRWQDSAHVDGWKMGYQPDVGVIDTLAYVVGNSPKALMVSSAITDQGAYMCPLSIPWSCIEACEEIGAHDAR